MNEGFENGNNLNKSDYIKEGNMKVMNEGTENGNLNKNDNIKLVSKYKVINIRNKENLDQYKKTTNMNGKDDINDKKQQDNNKNSGGYKVTLNNMNNSSRRNLVPPDGGWGWMVAFGSFIITLLLPAMAPCFGVLFSRYLLSEGTSSTTTAWIFNVQCFIWNIGGLICRPLCTEFGWRRVGIIGSVMTAVGLFISSFTPSPEFLFFSFSLLTGLGGGTVIAMCFTAIPQYFVKRRGVANAIMMAGVCMGQIVFPPFARFLQEEFGQRGGTMILSAVLLHACLGAAFFHPVEWHSKPSYVNDDDDDGEEETVERSGEEELFTKKDYRLNLNHALIHSNSTISFGDSVAGDLEPDLQAVIARAKLKRLGAVRGISTSSFASGISSTFSISTLDMVGAGILPTQHYINNEEESIDNDLEEQTDELEEQITSRNLCDILYRVIKGIISDLQVLRSPRALIICLGGMLSISGYHNFLMMLPFAITSAGLSLDTAALCISTSALTNLVVRMISSALSDLSWFRIRLCYVIGFLLISVAMTVFTMVDTPSLLLVTMAVYGCGVGCAMGLYNLVMIDVMGLERLAPVFGASCFAVGAGFISIGPFIGFIRDWSGSYRVSICFVAFMELLGFLLWLFMPLATRYDQRRESN